MKALKFELFNITAAGESTLMGSVAIARVALHGRKTWSALVLHLTSGKAWTGVIMVLGLWAGSYLEQPELDDNCGYDEDILAKRKWEWGFNYLQKPEPTDGMADNNPS